MLRVPGRCEGARHDPEEQEDYAAGMERPGAHPAGSIGLGLC